MNPVLCLVTDRRRFGAAWETALVDRVRAAANAGVQLIQIRERDLDGGPLMRLVSACIDAVSGTRTRVLVNDRLDVALAARAHGVHLRADSFAANRVRFSTPAGFVIGRSIHSVTEAIASNADEALDYLIFGNVFESASKPGRHATGLAELSEVVRITRLPVLAIGGVTTDRVAAVMAAGAAGVAGITMFDRAPFVS